MSPAAVPDRPRPGGTASLAGSSVARIGYGAMQLQRLRDDRAAAVALVRRAVELGVDHLDTAQFYGNGFVNEVLRDALRPAEAVVVSKVGADPDPGGPFPMRLAQQPHQLRASVEDNLRSLGLEQLPVVNLRRMEAGSRMQAEGDQLVDLDDQLAEMTAMRDEGLIGAIGVSSVDADTVRRSIAAGIVCVQNAYSLVDRQFEEIVELCAGEGIAWAPFFPLGRDFTGATQVVEHPVVREVATRIGASPSQVGLAWLLQHEPNILLIPGTASAAHLEDNLAAGNVHLDDAAVEALDGIAS